MDDKQKQTSGAQTAKPSSEEACSTPLNDILEERRRQDQKWGEQNHHPYKWLAILGEEVGESNKAILEGSLLQYRDELVQVAAVALAAIECLERGTWSQQAPNAEFSGNALFAVSAEMTG